MNRYTLFLGSLFCGFFALGLVVLRLAHADVDAGAGSGSAPIAALMAAGSGSASPPSATASPADALVDPTKNPLAAIDDIRAAKKTSWPLAVLVVLIAATKLLSYVGGVLAPVGKWLATKRNAMIVATAGTMLATAYNTLIAGGSWYAVLVAGGGVLLALLSPHAPLTAQAKAAAA